MPHWSCHYYRLETGSSFIVGDLNFSAWGSVFSMFIYSVLIIFNLSAISYPKARFIAALTSGILHLTLGFIHITRFINPFTFEVFGYEWSLGSSLREVIIVFPFGIACIAMAVMIIAGRKET